MKMQSATLILALLGLGSMTIPATGNAGNVGYYGDDCYGGDPAPVITAAGHTPVAVTSLTAGNLAGLQALFINGCSFSTTPEVNAAVTGGMALIWHDPNWNWLNSVPLPGGVAAAYVRDGGNKYDINFPAGSPIINGPGGTLDNSSLDNGGASSHGYVPAASLPAGAQVLATQDAPANVVTFSYATGAGKVVYSTIPLTCYFAGGVCGELSVTPAMRAYAANVIAWTLGGGEPEPATTCASEGYTGTKLAWCVKICESGISGRELDTWIQRWITQFRKLPYCATPGGGLPPV